MGLLKSVDNVPGIDYYDYRDDLYYNKYQFRMRVKVPCVRYTWYCKTISDLDAKINGAFKGYGKIRKNDLAEVKEHEPALKAIITLQTEKKKKQLGIRIEYQTLAIFSSNLQDLKDFANILGPNYNPDYTEVQTSQYAGVKHFVETPKHQYRVYLKSKRVDDELHEDLKNTLERTKSLHPSKALKKWMYAKVKNYGSWYFRWTSASHFIDYDDESTLSYLALVHGDILGKKYKLEKRPDNI